MELQRATIIGPTHMRRRQLIRNEPANKLLLPLDELHVPEDPIPAKPFFLLLALIPLPSLPST